MQTTNRWDKNAATDKVVIGSLTDEQLALHDEDIFCPRCCKFSLPRYYPGALGYWYTRQNVSSTTDTSSTEDNQAEVNGVIIYSNKGDELCSRCGDAEAGQARMEQSIMSDDELLLMRDWLIVDKDTQPADWNKQDNVSVYLDFLKERFMDDAISNVALYSSLTEDMQVSVDRSELE